MCSFIRVQIYDKPVCRFGAVIIIAKAILITLYQQAMLAAERKIREENGMGRDNPLRWFWVALWMLFLSVLSGCGNEPRMSPLPADAVIVAFGDSLTYGTGADDEHTYPHQLELLIGREVINAGVPGETTDQGVRRLPEELADYRPALVILMEGGNDFLRHYPAGDTRRNLRQMIELIRQAGSQVVLVGVPQPKLVLSSAELYQTLAEELQVPYLDGAMAEILSDKTLKSDLIHPNGDGYRRFAEAVAGFLREQGAINGLNPSWEK